MYKALQKAQDGHFDEFKTAKYVAQLADALNYCHSKKVKTSYFITFRFVGKGEKSVIL